MRGALCFKHLRGESILGGAVGHCDLGLHCLSNGGAQVQGLLLFFCRCLGPGFIVVEAEFNGLVVDVGLDLVALFFHDVLDVLLLVVKPAQVVGDQVQIVAAATSDQNDTLRVGLLAKRSGLLSIALAAGEGHEQLTTRTSRGALDIVCIEGIRHFLVHGEAAGPYEWAEGVARPSECQESSSIHLY